MTNNPTSEQTPKQPQAFLEAYSGVDLKLPTGKTVRCKVPPLSTAAEIIDLYSRVVESGDITLINKLIQRFPEAVGVNGEFEELSTMDFLELIPAFFASRPTRKEASP